MILNEINSLTKTFGIKIRSILEIQVSKKKSSGTPLLYGIYAMINLKVIDKWSHRNVAGSPIDLPFWEGDIAAFFI